MKMNDDKKKQLNDELFDFLIKQAAREVAEEEAQEAIDMCERMPQVVTSPDYEKRIAKILSSDIPKGKRPFRFKAAISVAVVAVMLFVLMATPVAADFRAYINQLVFGNAPTHNTVASLKYYDEYRAALIESGLERIYVPTHSRLRGLEPDIAIKTVQSHTLIEMHFVTDNSEFTINQAYPAHNIQGYDIERSDVEQFAVNGEVAYSWQSDGKYYLFYRHGDYYISLITNISREVAIEIAESLGALTLEEV